MDPLGSFLISSAASLLVLRTIQYSTSSITSRSRGLQNRLQELMGKKGRRKGGRREREREEGRGEEREGREGERERVREGERERGR